MSRSIQLIRHRAIGAVAVTLVLGACQSLPPDAFRLPETALETREIQTRKFENVADDEILSATVGVLQDLGYVIDELEKELGVLSASKRADATDAVEIAGRIALDMMSCVMTLLFACDNENYKKSDAIQDIRLTVVVLRGDESETTHAVRVTMQRIIWDRDGRISEQATIAEAEVYQAFFAKLNESVFLEKEGV